MRLIFDKGTLILDDIGESKDTLPQFVFDNRVDKWRTQGYKYRSVIEYLKEKQIPYEDRARRYQELKLESTIKFSPHPYQSEATEAWKMNKFIGIIELPTGAGKSYLGQIAIELTKRNALVVTPILDLLNQWYDLLCSAFGNATVGIIGGGYYEVRPLTVTTYESAVDYMDRLGDQWGLLIFDECHHLPGPMYSHAAEMSIAPYRLGLTATLERLDGRHILLNELIGPVVYTKRIKDLAGEYLSDYEVRKVTVYLSREEKERYNEARKELKDFLDLNNLSLGTIDGRKLFIMKSAQSQEGRRAMIARYTARKLAMGTWGS